MTIVSYCCPAQSTSINACASPQPVTKPSLPFIPQTTDANLAFLHCINLDLDLNTISKPSPASLLFVESQSSTPLLHISRPTSAGGLLDALLTFTFAILLPRIAAA
ncbi:uncharacterized protein RCO7_15058 [Rhynchosporium graminicola]|uniref:Uncharacterized protein n=1 Tax=Rhynchosporium graminicola TaxID=2792576 RepID=A0A1E1LIA6_9HELO|nr:uncharacterized protein RCO7_15058 [Rhynchosporium commune]